MLEENFITSMIKSNGNLLAFFERPIALALAVLTMLVWFLPVVVKVMRRARPVVPVEAPRFRAIQGACQTFVDRLPAHQVQPDLERAVAAASWREVEGGRVFGRKASGSDISPVMACVLALWTFDQRPERAPITIRST